MILEGGRIYTGDPALPRVHALPIDDRGRVSRGVEAWEGDVSAVSNERIDLAGRTVLPGLRDAGGRFAARASDDDGGDGRRAEALATAQRAAHAAGLVAITDLSADAETLRLWQTLDRDERATLRVTVALAAERAVAAADVGLLSGFGSERVRVGPVVIDPFAPDAETIAADLHRRGLDLLVHAEAGESLQAALRCLPPTDAPDARDRLYLHATTPAPDRVGIPIVLGIETETGPSSLPELLARHSPLAVGSGAGAMAPLARLAALRGAGADPAVALAAVTATPAYLDRARGRTGTLAPGAPADLVVLDGDPLAVEPEAVPDIRVAATMIAGRWVHGRPPW